jgi:hypothetical protein
MDNPAQRSPVLYEVARAALAKSVKLGRELVANKILAIGRANPTSAIPVKEIQVKGIPGRSDLIKIVLTRSVVAAKTERER